MCEKDKKKKKKEIQIWMDSEITEQNCITGCLSKRDVNSKILTMVHKAKHNNAPEYLCELIQPLTFARTTRRSLQTNLKTPKTHKRTFADRSFSVAGPTLWNRLPEKIRSEEDHKTFKKILKTFLFESCYTSNS